jgi:hypothetical protein
MASSRWDVDIVAENVPDGMRTLPAAFQSWRSIDLAIQDRPGGR